MTNSTSKPTARICRCDDCGAMMALSHAGLTTHRCPAPPAAPAARPTRGPGPTWARSRVLLAA